MNNKAFEKLIFNPLGLSDLELISQCKENERLFNALGEGEGLLGDKVRNRSESLIAKQIRYILIMYDKNSPLWLTHPDIVARKKQAALISGFDINSSSSSLEDVYLLKDKFLARSISSFIRYQHNEKLSALISNEQVLYELQHALREQMNEFKDDKQRIDHFKIKTGLLAEQDKILSLIENYKFSIWQGDEAAYDTVMNIEYGRKSTPEQIAKIELKSPRILGYNV